MYSIFLSLASHPRWGASGICMVREAVQASVHGSEGQPQALGACRARPLTAQRTGSSLATPCTSEGLSLGPPSVLSPPRGLYPASSEGCCAMLADFQSSCCPGLWAQQAAQPSLLPWSPGPQRLRAVG